MVSQVVLAAVAAANVGDTLDSKAGWMTAGTLLLVAALTGAGGKWLGKEMPVFKTVPRQGLAALLGLAALYYGYQLELFRVTKLVVDVTPSQHDAECPVQIDASATVRVAGGDGDVDYRFDYPDHHSDIETVHFDEDGGKSVSHRRILSYESIGAKGIHGPVVVRVMSPDSRTSQSVSLDVTCRRPAARGFNKYTTDGYQALYPHGWRVVEDDMVRTTYHRSRFESADGDYFVLIDWSPSVEVIGGPRDLGKGYEMVSYEPVRLGEHDAYEWRFRDDGEERANYLFTHAGDSYAVMGGGDDVDAMVLLARRIAASVSAR